MPFFFSDIKGDSLMHKINLRDLSMRAEQWDHPIQGVINFHKAYVEKGKDILSVPKKDRELYAVSIVAMALSNDLGGDWWIHIPKKDPPDGIAMTFHNEEKGTMALIREIEVVEHRTEPDDLFNVIHKKLKEKTYGTGTILVCLALTNSAYDTKALLTKLKSVSTGNEHVFIVFSGVTKKKQEDYNLSDIGGLYSMIQFLPKSAETTFHISKFIEDFDDKFQKGQEARFVNIAAKSIDYGTVNKKFHPK